MAARFPQSATSLNYRIKAEWADKIHAVWWAAGADSIHALRSGETATTIINRAASGCTFDSEEGVIAGDNSTYFTDTESGGFGGLAHNAPHTILSSWRGDLFGGIGSTARIGIGTATPPDPFNDGSSIRAQDYEIRWRVRGGGGRSDNAGASTGVVHMVTVAMRYDPDDPINNIRAWSGGSEITAKRDDGTPNASTAMSSVWLGGSATGTGNARMHWECALIADALSDADMATITADPAVVLEIVEADTTPPTLSNPTATATGQTTASGSVTTDEGNGTLYYLASENSTESAATVKGGDSQAVTGTGVQNVGVTGLTHSTAYYLHFVHVDAAENESDVASSSQFTTDSPPPPATKGVRVQLSAGAENLTGLSVRWWDDPTASGAPDYSVDNEATDGSRWLEIDLDSTTANDVDDLGYLLVFKAGETADDDMVAAGRVPITDISE